MASENHAIGDASVIGVATAMLLTPVLVSETRKYLWNDRLDDCSNEEPPAIGDRSV